MSSSVIVFLISFVLGVFLTPTFRLIALRLAILDKPSNRKIQTEPVPYLGGIAVLLAVFLSLFAASKFESSWTRQHPEGWIILLVSLMVLLVGLIDDFVPVNYKFKLIFQVTTSLLLTFYLGTTSTRVSLVETDWINVCATALLLVFFMNAINFFDNWNGATAITIGSSSLFLGILMFNNSQNFLGSVSFAISGALMGFLPWNFPKAKIFLGEAQTLFLYSRFSLHFSFL
jgi:UDP-GlcNAc:undecaprenyl-phosphate GlcNAc-1-phosphate transferase